MLLPVSPLSSHTSSTTAQMKFCVVCVGFQINFLVANPSHKCLENFKTTYLSLLQILYVIPLSAQQLVSCDRNSFEYCRGTGSPVNAFMYIISNGGLGSDVDYPYIAENGTCEASQHRNDPQSRNIYWIYGHAHPNRDLTTSCDLQVCNQPATATIASNSTAFNTYTGLIFHGECGSTISKYLTHGIRTGGRMVS